MTDETAATTEGGGADRPIIPTAARAVLTIDLAALRANYARLCAMAAPAECAAVVKADGYGLGLEPIARALRAEGCGTFFVATIAEAAALRSMLEDVVIYVTDGLLPGLAGALAAIDARPVLGSIEEIDEWCSFCARSKSKRAAAIHIDTGMNRLGLAPGDVPFLAAKPDLTAQFNVTLVMSHLVAGEVPDNPKSEEQAELFDALRATLPATPASLANSAGLLRGKRFHYDLARPGIALYGGHVMADEPNPMQPVVTLAARILQVRDLRPGDTIGYNQSYKAAAPMRVATIATGYGDGVLRALSASNDEPGLPAYIGDHKAPLVGRISMDVIGLDVTGVPASLARRGAMAELIGKRVTIDDIAKRAGTISYEVLTRLGTRFDRVYIGAEG